MRGESRRHTTFIASPDCLICENRGILIVEDDLGRRWSEPCVCQVERPRVRTIEQARIPARYERCTLESYEYRTAQEFVRSYPLETCGAGLLLTGSIGVGKTHLAVGVLRSLIAERGARGIFADYREMLKQVQHSYNPNVAGTEQETLKPVFDVEVLVLDERGHRSRPSGCGTRWPIS